MLLLLLQMVQLEARVHEKQQALHHLAQENQHLRIKHQVLEAALSTQEEVLSQLQQFTINSPTASSTSSRLDAFLSGSFAQDLSGSIISSGVFTDDNIPVDDTDVGGWSMVKTTAGGFSTNAALATAPSGGSVGELSLRTSTSVSTHAPSSSSYGHHSGANALGSSRMPQLTIRTAPANIIRPASSMPGTSGVGSSHAPSAALPPLCSASSRTAAPNIPKPPPAPPGQMHSTSSAPAAMQGTQEPAVTAGERRDSLLHHLPHPPEGVTDLCGWVRAGVWSTRPQSDTTTPDAAVVDAMQRYKQYVKAASEVVMALDAAEKQPGGNKRHHKQHQQLKGRRSAPAAFKTEDINSQCGMALAGAMDALHSHSQDMSMDTSSCKGDSSAASPVAPVFPLTLPEFLQLTPMQSCELVCMNLETGKREGIEPEYWKRVSKAVSLR